VSATPAYILCIETANAVTSVAISKDGNCLSLKDIPEANKAADKLHRIVEELLEETNLAFSNLSAVAVSAGPGSYTGLRIAAAAAKGYCLALDIPLIAVSTLQAMVQGIRTRYHQSAYDEYVPMIDARRMEVFTSFYDNNLNCTRYFPSLVIQEDFPTLFNPKKKYILFGNGAQKSGNFFDHSNVNLFRDFLPSAEDLCLLGYTGYLENKISDLAYFEPSYYKAFYSTQQHA
jgi:tRNA threonylcarbamoyladenosine biosynthesis protein TsaB